MSYTILQNLNYAAPYPGNLMRSLFDLQIGAKKNNIDMVYVFPENAKELYWIGEMIENNQKVYFKPNSFRGACKLFNRIVKKHNINLIHTHFWNINDLLCIRLIKLYHPFMSSIIHHHNHYFASKSSTKEKIKRTLLKCNANIGCSNDVADKLREQNFNNVYSVENAIDFSRLDTFSHSDNEEKSFLLFGFDYYRKGVDIVLDAFDKLRDKYKNITLNIVFAANEQEGLDKIKERFGHIPDWVKTLPPTDNIAKYYKNATAFISASREEGFCYSIIEAAYCDCQSIISDIPGHRTDVPEIKVFKTNSAEELTNKIEQVLNESTGDRIRINKLQKNYVINQYGLESWSNDILKIYKNTIR